MGTCGQGKGAAARRRLLAPGASGRSRRRGWLGNREHSAPPDDRNDRHPAARAGRGGLLREGAWVLRETGNRCEDRDPRHGAELVPALLSGDAQFSGLNVGHVAIAKSNGVPIRVVAAGALYRKAAVPVSASSRRPASESHDRATSWAGASRSTPRARLPTLACSSGSSVAASPRTTFASSKCLSR